MLYTLKAPAAAAEHTVTFHLDPSAAGVETHKAKIVDLYAKVERAKEPDLTQPVSLSVRLDYPEALNAKGTTIADSLDTAFSIISNRIKIRQTDMNKHFNFLQEKPSLRALKYDKTHCYYQISVPNYAAILCNHKYFFPALGFDNQKEYNMADGKNFYGFVNRKGEPLVVDSTVPRDPKEYLSHPLQANKEFFALEQSELDLLPKQISLDFVNYDRRADVQFHVGDGTFPAFAANFIKALDYVLHNELNLKRGSIRIQSSPSQQVVVVSKVKSPSGEMPFQLLLSIVPPDDFPFLAFSERTIDSMQDSEVSTPSWPKAGSSSDDARNTMPRPFAVLTTDSGQVPTSFHTDYGHGYCLATVDSEGKVTSSEDFALVSRLQRSLTVYFIDENKKKIVFPQDMIVYMNLRLF